jgi:phospholipid/cholesterol/gamma-HCH transport system permease protein
VLAGLMVAGRIGAAMAAELGTMRVTEQIDALTTLSTNRGGAQGVGKATTNAVVSASILILISNYIVTELFFSR